MQLLLYSTRPLECNSRTRCLPLVAAVPVPLVVVPSQPAADELAQVLDTMEQLIIKEADELHTIAAGQRLSGQHTDGSAAPVLSSLRPSHLSRR